MQKLWCLLLLPTLLLIMVPAHASTPSQITGTFGGPLNITGSETVGSNTFITASGPLSFVGGIQGAATYNFTIALHNAAGLANVKGRIAFTGSVAGSQQGSMTILINGIISISGTVLMGAQGQLVLGDGSGGLTGIHGEGSFVSLPSNVATQTYSVEVHFDPS